MYSQGFAIPKNLDSNVKSKLALLTKQYHHDFISKKQKKKMVSKLSTIPNFPNFPQLSSETNTKQNSHHYQKFRVNPSIHHRQIPHSHNPHQRLPNSQN